VTQQARNLAVGEPLRRPRFVIRDRDGKFSGPFDEVFRSEDVSILNPDPGSASEYVRGAMGPHGPDRMPGLDAGLRPPPPWSGCFGPTPLTTTPEGRIEASA
jgi:hypothetical protein